MKTVLPAVIRLTAIEYFFQVPSEFEKNRDKRSKFFFFNYCGGFDCLFTGTLQK